MTKIYICPSFTNYPVTSLRIKPEEVVMMWKHVVLCMFLSTTLALDALAQAPKNPRGATLFTKKVLAEKAVFGGAITATVEVAPVDELTPAYVNGQSTAALADMLISVQLRAAQDNVFGARVAGEFIPYQTVRVQITNLSQAGSETLSVKLAPHVGQAEGWHYASNIALPPVASAGDPFGDLYGITVTLESDDSLYVHSDALPPSSLLVKPGILTLYNDTTKLGTAGGGSAGIAPSTLPLGNVDKQVALVDQFKLMESKLPDFVGASVVYTADTGHGETLQSAFNKYEDPGRYHASRGLTATHLSTAEDNVANALANRPTGPAPDCNRAGVIHPLECGEWVEKGAQRMIYLNLLHELDEIQPKVAAGNTDAISGAGHNWDEAWAFWQAINGTAKSREANCTKPEFGPAANVDCNLVNSVDTALQLGATIVAQGGTGIQSQIDIIEQRLTQIWYLAVYHEVFSMRSKDPGDTAAFGKARAEGVAFFKNIEYLVPGFDATALNNPDQAAFTQAVAQDFMGRLKTAMAGILPQNYLGDPTTLQ